MKQERYVSASEIADYVYCAEAWRLKHKLGFQGGNLKEKERGKAEHVAWEATERRTATAMSVGWKLAIAASAAMLLLAVLRWAT